MERTKEDDIVRHDEETGTAFYFVEIAVGTIASMKVVAVVATEDDREIGY